MAIQTVPTMPADAISRRSGPPALLLVAGALGFVAAAVRLLR